MNELDNINYKWTSLLPQEIQIQILILVSNELFTTPHWTSKYGTVLHGWKSGLRRCEGLEYQAVSLIKITVHWQRQVGKCICVYRKSQLLPSQASTIHILNSISRMFVSKFWTEKWDAVTNDRFCKSTSSNCWWYSPVRSCGIHENTSQCYLSLKMLNIIFEAWMQRSMKTAILYVSVFYRTAVK